MAPACSRLPGVALVTQAALGIARAPQKQVLPFDPHDFSRRQAPHANREERRPAAGGPNGFFHLAARGLVTGVSPSLTVRNGAPDCRLLSAHGPAGTVHHGIRTIHGAGAGGPIYLGGAGSSSELCELQAGGRTRSTPDTRLASHCKVSLSPASNGFIHPPLWARRPAPVSLRA